MRHIANYRLYNNLYTQKAKICMVGEFILYGVGFAL